MLGGEQVIGSPASSSHRPRNVYLGCTSEAVRKIKGEEDRSRPNAGNLPINLGISRPHRLQPHSRKRINVFARHKRIAGAAMRQIPGRIVCAELQDRYGDPPESVLNLLAAAGELRLLCERLGIAQLDRKRTQIDILIRQRHPAAVRSTTMLSRRNPAAQTGRRDLRRNALHIRFAAAAADSRPQQGSTSLARTAVDPGMMMKLVSRNAKRGAQFTPQGVLPAANLGQSSGCARRNPQLCSNPRIPQVRQGVQLRRRSVLL